MQISPIFPISLNGREFLIKRDDLIDRYLAGNKYRKLYTLLQTPSNKFTKIISYGGTQSNAMLAIAAMCKQKSWEFIYYTKPLSVTQKEQNSGNFYEALSLGMQHQEIADELYKDFIASLRVNLDEKSFIVDQGGAVAEAEAGLRVLAGEIQEQSEILNQHNITALATPSGTGTTALFLALALPEYTVYTTPCVGDVEYLKTQMLSLVDTLPANLKILSPKRSTTLQNRIESFLRFIKKQKMLEWSLTCFMHRRCGKRY